MYSTLTAVLETTNDWYLNIDNGSLNGVLSLSLSPSLCLSLSLSIWGKLLILSTITFYLKSLNFMEKVRDYVFRQILVRMYEALILHYFDYYSEVWACLANCLSDRLQKLQNRAARIINYLGYEHRSIARFLEWPRLGNSWSKAQKAVGDLHL